MKKILRLLLPVLLFGSSQKSQAFDYAEVAAPLVAVAAAGCALWRLCSSRSEDNVNRVYPTRDIVAASASIRRSPRYNNLVALEGGSDVSGFDPVTGNPRTVFEFMVAEREAAEAARRGRE